MKIHKLSLIIDGKTLLHELSFEIPKQSTFLILGPNGAGKTLLLRCLAGLSDPSSGNIIKDEKNLAWVPLSHPLPFSYKVNDLLLMGRYAHHQGFPQNSDRKVIAAAAERVGITDLCTRQYNSLSRGEQTKVDMARALASESRLMLLDEPFSNLDIDASLQMVDLFRELREEGMTLILSHHDLYSARNLASHGLLMKKGQIVTHGPIQDIFREEFIQAAYNVRPLFSEPSFVRFEKLEN